MAQNGTLESYLDALHATARFFPTFIDFSIPSPVTARTDNTYDGSHYAPAVNRQIARIVLAPDSANWGLDVKRTDGDGYRASYRKALADFEATTTVGKVSQ